jgi:hypothetical protein|nr:MAG TPA: hypothetical protein [Caudoviricetes sp.]
MRSRRKNAHIRRKFIYTKIVMIHHQSANVFHYILRRYNEDEKSRFHIKDISDVTTLLVPKKNL